MKQYLPVLPVAFGILVALVPAVAYAADVKLLQPLCGSPTVSGTGPFDIMFAYFNCAGIWLYDIAIGVCVLWVLVGGIHIIVSGDNSELYSRGKSYIIGSISGLLLLIFAPVVLRFINGGFYQ
jgi:hypothetical protein